jgi:hypothetical protein
LYDEGSCQRAFVIIDVPGLDLAFADDFISRLESKTDVLPVIESISRADRGLILEVFATCSQAQLVRRLSRELDNILLNYKKVLKTTLTCYGYDEEEVKQQQVAVA